MNWTENIFYPKPSQWGLRGDPSLWKELEALCSEVEKPQSEEDFEAFLNEGIEKLTGEGVEKGKNFYVEKYDKGGLSRGSVCSDFWLEKGIPLLVSRLNPNK